MERPTCKTCPYWKTDEDDVHRTGICRRKAPRARILTDGDDRGYVTFPIWPETLDNEWCGEHSLFPAWIEVQRKTDPPATVE
jgi:hypothetical protein